ncbi:MAG: dienelactone hydrolase family protein [Nitrososphaerales archaeon]|nr:dienelactone hydrolase family protein [Nitrososphaerales archaeon]
MARTSLGGWDFFLARGKGALGIVLIHEIFGYNDYSEAVAKNLASAGFTAASIDLFRGKKAATLEEGFKLRSAVTKEVLSDGVSQGVELLRREAGAKKVGTMGFCMGGGFALQAACDLGLDFTVDYYGMIENEQDASKLAGPVLMILASEDERVTPWAFQKFLPAAMKYKKRVEVQLYPNARHAFHRPNWEGHNPEAANDAWDKTVRFLSQVPSR